MNINNIDVNHRKQLKNYQGRSWDEDVHKLIKLAGTMPMKELAVLLDRTPKAVQNKCHLMGISYRFEK